MNFISKSLRNKLIVVLLTVSLGSIAIVGFFSFAIARNSIHDAELRSLEAINKQLYVVRKIFDRC